MLWLLTGEKQTETELETCSSLAGIHRTCRFRLLCSAASRPGMLLKCQARWAPRAGEMAQLLRVLAAQAGD